MYLQYVARLDWSNDRVAVPHLGGAVLAVKAVELDTAAAHQELAAVPAHT